MSTNENNVHEVYFDLMEDLFLFVKLIDPTEDRLAIILTFTKVLTAIIAMSG